MWREHQVTEFKDATGGEGLERSFWKEVKSKHWNALEGHLAGNYVSFTPQEGRFDRVSMLAHLQKVQLDDFSLGDLQTELNTETLVVTYAITMRGTFARPALAIRTRPHDDGLAKAESRVASDCPFRFGAAR